MKINISPRLRTLLIILVFTIIVIVSVVILGGYDRIYGPILNYLILILPLVLVLPYLYRKYKKFEVTNKRDEPTDWKVRFAYTSIIPK